MPEQKPNVEMRSIPGMMNRGPGARFAAVEHAENAGATFRRIAAYFGKEKAMVLGMLAAVVFGTLCGVYAPSVQSRAIDIIAGSGDGSLLPTVGLMAAVYLLYSVSQLFQGLISARLSQRLVKRMRKELFSKLIDLPVKYLDTHSHGDVMSRMTNDVENISTTVSQSLPSLFSGVLTILGTVAIMLWYCWQLALLSFATVLLTVLATKLLSGRVRKYSRKRQAYLGQLNGTVEEMVSGYHTVVAYQHEDITTENFCSTSDELTKAGIKTDIFSGVMGPIMNCIGNIWNKAPWWSPASFSMGQTICLTLCQTVWQNTRSFGPARASSPLRPGRSSKRISGRTPKECWPMPAPSTISRGQKNFRHFYSSRVRKTLSSLCGRDCASVRKCGSMVAGPSL